VPDRRGVNRQLALPGGDTAGNSRSNPRVSSFLRSIRSYMRAYFSAVSSWSLVASIKASCARAASLADSGDIANPHQSER
jgi:hypothetical protein